MSRTLLRCRKHKGFTLTEILVTLSVLTSLTLMAAPSMQQLTLSYRATHASFELMSALQLARSEAIKRNTTVAIAPLSGAWQNGWTVTPAADPTQEIRRQSNFSGLSISGPASGIVFLQDGRVDATSDDLRFQIEVGSATDRRCVSLSVSGRPNSVKGSCPA